MSSPLDWVGKDGLDQLITWQGKCLTWKVLKEPGVHHPGGKRGNVQEFSKASRLRMLKYIATIDWDKAKPVLFVTVTYPDTVGEPNYKVLSSERAVFFRYLEKHCAKELGAIWRLEWVCRKSGERKGEFMPHFHFLVFGQAYIDYKALNDYWRRTIHEDGYVRTEVEAMANERQVGYYVSKYAAKVSTDSLVNGAYHNRCQGRKWGVLRKQLIPTCPKFCIRVAREELYEAAVHRLRDMRPDNDLCYDDSFTLLGEFADEIGKYLFVE